MSNANLGGQRIDNVRTPSDASDAANKQYVDDAIADALAAAPTISSPDDSTAKILTLASLGAGGASVDVYAGTADPGGAVSANAGSIYIRQSAAASMVYVNTSAADPGTTWTALA